MATVYSTINLPAKATFNPALDISETGEIAVCTEDYVEVFNFSERPEIQSEHLSHRVTRITALDNQHVLKTGLNIVDIIPSSEEYLRHSIAFEALLGRATNTMVQSQQSLKGYFSAQWSPRGMDIIDRSVLCCATLDNRVSIYTRLDKMHSWVEAVRLSDLLADHYTEQTLDEDTGPLIHKYTQLSHRLATTALDWSPHLHVFSGVNQAGEGLALSSYSCLATATKSSHLVLWQIQAPVLLGEDVQIQKIMYLGDDIQVSTLCWCSDTPLHLGYVVVGCCDGRVLAVDVTDYTVQEMWSEKDNIRVTNIAWISQEDTILVTKGSYLIMLSVQSRTDFTVLHTTTQRISGKLPISGLTLSRNQKVYLSCSDASLSSGFLVGDYENDDLHVKLEPIVLKRSEAKATRTLHNHGIILSRNAVMVIPLQSPGEFFSNQRYPDPLKLQMSENISPEDMVDIIMTGNHESLVPVSDILFALKYHFSQDMCWPKTLDIDIQEVITGATDLSQSSLFHLRLFRFMLKIQILYLPKTSPEDALGMLESTVRNVESSIVTKHIMAVINLCLECGVTENDLSSMEKQSICTMCSYLSAVEHTLTDGEITRMLQMVHKLLPFTNEPHKHRETCIICKTNFSLVNMNEVTCDKGHRFARCCQTLISTQHVPYRVCEWCGMFAIQKSKGTHSIWWQQLQSNRCTFCDNTLVAAM